MLSFLLLLLSLPSAISLVVFHEDFQIYHTGSTKVVYLTFNGTWYRSDVNKFTGVFKVKGPNTLIASKYLAVFAEGASSVTCVEVPMTLGSVYQLSFDHTWEAYNTSTLHVSWNNVIIFTFPSSGMEGSFRRQTQQLPPITIPVNQLCFGGEDPLSGIRIGLVIDNIDIMLLHAAGPGASNSSGPITTNFSSSGNGSQSNSTNSSSNISNNWTSNSSYNTPADFYKNQANGEPQLMNMEWVQKFVEKFNYFLKFTTFVGFPYLISNLLNFWNIIVLYYFLPLKPYVDLYKTQLQQLCRISLQQGSLLSLMKKSFNRQLSLPNIQCEKIPPVDSNWPSFSQVGFTSQILINNIQFYFAIINCAIKLVLLGLARKLVKQIACLSSFMLKSKIKYLDIFCYQIVSSSPGMFIPLAIMVSMNSSSGFTKFSEKINNACQFLVIPMVGISMCLPTLMKKNQIISKPQKKLIKSTIMVESQHEGSVCSFKMRTAKMTQKMSYEIEYQRQLMEYYKSVRNQKFIHQMYIADTYNHLLFFAIPFLIGLQCLWLFFLTNFLFLIFVSYNLWKKGYLIRQFNSKQFWFRLTIKLVFLTIHILFALLYGVEKQFIYLDTNEIVLVSFLTIIMIIVGALIETIHTITALIYLIYEIWQKIKPVSNKIDHISETNQDQKRKTMDLQFHLRKISTFKLNQIESVNEEEPESEKKSTEEQRKKTKLMGIKTERLSKIIFQIKDEGQNK